MATQRLVDSRMVIGVACLLLAASLPPVLAAAMPAAGRGLGQVVSEGVEAEGVRLPPGSTLFDDSLVLTGDRPATFYLRGGQVLVLASHSSAHLEQAFGGVKVAVRSGSATVRGTEAEAVTVSGDMHAFLAQDGSSRVAYRAARRVPGIDADPRQEVATEAEVGAPTITDAEKVCLPNVPYPLLDAIIRPGSDVRVAKVYFRAAQHPHFYAVEMTGIADDFEGILPAPGPGTDQVVYYVEAVSTSLESSRTQEYTAQVIEGEECEDRGGAGFFTGKDPGIVVLSTVAGAPPTPPGFLPVGLVAAGGGLGPGALAGIVGGGLVGGLILIDELDDDDEPPASPVTP